MMTEAINADSFCDSWGVAAPVCSGIGEAIRGIWHYTSIWTAKGVDATAGWAARSVTWLQTEVLSKGWGLLGVTNDYVTKCLVGCGWSEKLKTNYRVADSLTWLTLTTLCGVKAMNSLGLSWKYLPIPILRSKKIVTITSVNLPGDDVKVDKVRTDERSLEKTWSNLVRAALWTAGCMVGILGFTNQVIYARGEQNPAPATGSDNTQ